MNIDIISLVKALLKDTIAFRREFVTLTGSINASLMLSQAWHWQQRCTSKDGFWWKTYEEWTQETGMTRHELDGARAKCGDLLEVDRRGVPAKNWYRLNVNILASRLADLHKPDCRNSADRPAEIGVSITKTTSKTTSKSTPLPPSGGETDDQAIGLIKRFQDEFRHYKVLGAKKIKKELESARTLLDGTTEEEIFALTRAALADNFRKSWVGSLSLIVENFSKLRVQFGSALSAPAADEPRDYEARKTDEEIRADWKSHLAFCKEQGIKPVFMKPACVTDEES